MTKVAFFKTVRAAFSHVPARNSLYDNVNPALLPLLSARYV